MKTLDQILEFGTDAEQELIRLAKESPSNPQATLHQVLVQKLFASSVLAAGTAGLAYAIQNTETTMQCVGGIGIALGGLGTLAHGYDLIKACRAGYYFNQPKKWEKVISSTPGILFYLSAGKLTSNPTPVEVLLGTRVYPKQHFDGLKDIPSQNYGFITNVIVREVILENFTEEESDYVPGIGIGYRTVRKVKMQIQFEKENTSFKFDAKYEVGCEPSLFNQLTKIRTPFVSLLLEAKKEESKIIQVFPYHSHIDQSENKIKYSFYGYA